MDDTARKCLFYWAPLLAFVALIFALSSLSSLPLQTPEFLSDKVLHFLEYAALGLLACRAVLSLGWSGERAWVVWLVAFVFSCCLGGADEFYQSFVPLRDADWRDWVADLGGGAVGGFGYLFALRLWIRR